MGLTSEQAKAMNAQPRINPVQEDQMISLFAEGQSVKEVAVQFPDFAQGTIANFRTRKKEQIAELRRKRSVQFEDLFVVRKQARLDDLQDQRNTASMLIKAHLASCFATDPITGQREFVEQLVDARKLKVYVEMLDKALKMVAVETGQLMRLNDRWAEKVLGVNGKGGIDYPALVQANREWEAGAPERERQAAVRKEWHWYDMEKRYASVTDLERAREQVQRDKDKASGMSPAEYRQAIWDRRLERDRERNYDNLEQFCANEVAGTLAEYGPDGVTLAEIAEGVTWSLPQVDGVQAEVDVWFAGPVCAALVEAARDAVPEPEPDVPLEPPPGLSPTDGEWVTEWVDD